MIIISFSNEGIIAKGADKWNTEAINVLQLFGCTLLREELKENPETEMP